MRRLAAILLAGALGALCVVLAFAPAWWLERAVSGASGGRVLLREPEGTVWRGEGTLVLTDPGARVPAGVRVPGRLRWSVSAAALLRGTLAVRLEDEAALAVPMLVQASLGPRIAIEAGGLRLPASALAGLGAPWNTIRPGGTLRLSWSALRVDAVAGTLQGNGSVQWEDATSGLSPVAPFGHYRLSGEGNGAGAALRLATLAGPLEMTGDGTIAGDGRVRFHGDAHVQAGTDESVATQLSGLVSLLGRREGNSAILDFGN